MRYPDIIGADLYRTKNLCKFPVAQAHRVFKACFIHSSSLSSFERNRNIVVRSVNKKKTRKLIYAEQKPVGVNKSACLSSSLVEQGYNL